MNELFGSTEMRDIIINQNILLQPYGRIKLADSKLQSLGNKYMTIHPKYLWYYPNLDGSTDLNDPEEASITEMKSKRYRNAKEIVAG